VIRAKLDSPTPAVREKALFFLRYHGRRSSRRSMPSSRVRAARSAS